MRKEMSVEVLLSCMDQADDSIIHHSNLDSESVLVINQVCEGNDGVCIINDRHRIINTSTKGLSVSRNMAVDNARGDICVLADDDEVFSDNLSDIISNAYDQLPDADVIVFDVKNLKRKLRNKVHRLRGLEIYRVASVHITFRRQSVKGKVRFDEKIGSGTDFGAGEENKFMRDCYRNGLKIYYYPSEIATLNSSDSVWFSDYDYDFIYKYALVSRYVMGLPLAIIYEIRFLLFKRNLYKNKIRFFSACKAAVKGLHNKDLYK